MALKLQDFSVTARTRLLEEGKTITQLSDEIGHPRNSVSLAIHSDRLPGVRQKVAEALRIKKWRKPRV